MPSVIAVGIFGVWLLMQTVAGRLPARLLSYREGNLGSAGAGETTVGVGAVKRGTRIDPTPGFGWPTSGSVSQEFHPGHDGIDIANQQGTPIGASYKGTVVFAQTGDNGGYGNRVMVDHGGGVVTTYNHLSRIDARAGQQIRKGESVGLMGSTGKSTGSHLHFEVIVAGRPVDPRSYIGGNP